MAKKLKNESKVIGALARAKSLSAEDRKRIAKEAAEARWGERLPFATHKGNFREDFGIDVDCYVLDDQNKTAVISQRGMGAALNLGKGGNALKKFINGKTISSILDPEIARRVDNPLIFNASTPDMGSRNLKAHGYDVTLLIDICRAIIKAHAEGQLLSSQENIAKQANLIVGASAKAGIKGLVYALAGYRPEVEEVISAFRHYIQEEAKKYEKEFPTELYAEWQRLYNITPPLRGKNWKEMHLTVDHVYRPLAKSNGKLLELLRSAKTSKGDRNKKLFQFLNEIGARALRMQLGRILEMAESSSDKYAYEAKIVERFGGQIEIPMATSYPIS